MAEHQACVKPHESGGTTDTATGPPDHLTIIEQNSILADSRTIALREHEGRMWELVEQEWHDDTVALCSTSPVRVRSTVIRPVTVWLPVQFQ